jgi:hypothetical protein
VRELKAQGIRAPIIAPTLERFSITTYVELPKDKYNEWKTLDMVIPDPDARKSPVETGP